VIQVFQHPSFANNISHALRAHNCSTGGVSRTVQVTISGRCINCNREMTGVSVRGLKEGDTTFIFSNILEGKSTARIFALHYPHFSKSAFPNNPKQSEVVEIY
jgi:hypothetical protein